MTKNLLLLCSLLFISFSASSQITYIDFGVGLATHVDTKRAMDIDEDGVIDFYINGVEGELGFSPIWGKGCFTSPSAVAFTQFGARELKRHTSNALIKISDFNMFDYIDDDRGSAYSTTGGLANGWAHDTEVLVGFAVFADNFVDVRNGWMSVKLDLTTNEIIILEMAFTEMQPIGQGSINAGYKGDLTAVPNLDGILNSVSVGPNPADAFAMVNYNYTGSATLNISVFSTTGKLIYSETPNNSYGMTRTYLNTNSWDAGVYFVQFSTTEGVQTERLLVSH